MLSKLADQIPREVKAWIPQTLKDRLKKSDLYLEDRAEVDNIYHCCTHKSASQWVNALLGDPITFRHSGLDVFKYQTEWMDGHDPRPYHERHFSRPFPTQTIASPLYLHYSCFEQMPKPEKYRAFFVLRDPRDVVISWYFSMKHSHPLMGRVPEIRRMLKRRSKHEGLRWCINHLTDYGLFDAQRSWLFSDDPKVRIYKYESLTGIEQASFVHSLLVEHCTIPLSDHKVRLLLHRYAFGDTQRKQGEEDIESHQRKGVAGDWQNHFTKDLKSAFKSATDEVAAELGYQW